MYNYSAREKHLPPPWARHPRLREPIRGTAGPHGTTFLQRLFIVTMRGKTSIPRHCRCGGRTRSPRLCGASRGTRVSSHIPEVCT